jgi:hypothetical protein
MVDIASSFVFPSGGNAGWVRQFLSPRQAAAIRYCRVDGCAERFVPRHQTTSSVMEHTLESLLLPHDLMHTAAQYLLARRVARGVPAAPTSLFHIALKDNSTMQDAEYFVAKADECLRLVKLARETAQSLEDMAHEFMAKAVDLDTTRDRNQKTSRRKP